MRRQRIAEIVTALVDEAGEGVILLDDIELLFEPSLAVDPLRPSAYPCERPFIARLCGT